MILKAQGLILRNIISPAVKYVIFKFILASLEKDEIFEIIFM